ncbi:MAG: hypothetical protein SOV66_01405 [Sodaliphilus sp.]|nr:hypothetical protein [Sodaliphilus sp.]
MVQGTLFLCPDGTGRMWKQCVWLIPNSISQRKQCCGGISDMSGATVTAFPHYSHSKHYQTMSEIGTLSLERLNNGAHFLFISNVLARAETDANVKSKLSAQIVSLKAAMEQEDKD